MATLVGALLLPLTLEGAERGSAGSYQDAVRLFRQRQYDQALPLFLAVYQETGSRKSVIQYIDECLRQTREPWALGRPLPLPRLIPLLRERLAALKALTTLKGDIVSEGSEPKVRFPAAVWEQSSKVWMEALLAGIQRCLATLPEPHLILTAEGPFRQVPEAEEIVAASARVASEIVRRGLLPQDKIIFHIKEAPAWGCLVAMVSGRTASSADLAKNMVRPIFQVDRRDSGQGATVLMNVVFPNPGSVKNWRLGVKDPRGEPVFEWKASTSGFWHVVEWLPQQKQSGFFVPFLQADTADGPLNMTGNTIVLERPVSASPQAVPRITFKREAQHRQVIFFEENKTAVLGQSLKYVKIWGRDILPTNPTAKAVIVGCASPEEDRQRPALRLERAQALKATLEKEFGIVGDRLETRAGHATNAGENQPVAWVFLEARP